jgi:hypothetical protein
MDRQDLVTVAATAADMVQVAAVGLVVMDRTVVILLVVGVMLHQE